MSVLSKKRACELSRGDVVSLPVELMHTEAIVKNSYIVSMAKGKPIHVIEFETAGDTPWTKSAAEWGFYPDQHIHWYRPYGRTWAFLKWLNSWTFGIFSQA